MSNHGPTYVSETAIPRTLSKPNLNAVADYIRSGHVSKVVFMVGAGISTSAGIPDFRSPTTGLYANLAKLNLPYPEAIFDLDYFEENPLPFYTLAKEIFPGNIRPTIAHTFMKLVSDKGLVSRIFTQNIDCLERAAGISPDLIVEAHGSFATHSCITCKKSYPADLMKQNIEQLTIPKCLDTECKGFVKPDIVFFGEALPTRFFQERLHVADADLVIIMGTSLSVQPFASLPIMANLGTPRLLINLEVVGDIGCRIDDVVVLGGCDAGVRRLAKALGWAEELEKLWAETDPERKIDKGKGKPTVYDGPMDMDEVLRNQVESLTREVERGLSLAERHRQFVGGHLKQEDERRRKLEEQRKLALAAAQGTATYSAPLKESEVNGKGKEKEKETPIDDDDRNTASTIGAMVEKDSTSTASEDVAALDSTTRASPTTETVMAPVASDAPSSLPTSVPHPTDNTSLHYNTATTTNTTSPINLNNNDKQSQTCSSEST
ncbi:SIR2 family histone deacetylase [Peziza echinospora]|nr:SIR2 family histone deacetylase [Peziza echinospora]